MERVDLVCKADGVNTSAGPKNEGDAFNVPANEATFYTKRGLAVLKSDDKPKRKPRTKKEEAALDD